MVPVNYLSLGILKNVPRPVSHQAETLTAFVTLLLLENECSVSLVLGWWNEFEDCALDLSLHCLHLVTGLLESLLLVDLSSGMLRAVMINCMK